MTEIEKQRVELAERRANEIKQQAAEIRAMVEAIRGTAVHHPTHYNPGKFEVWDVISDWKLGFLLGNVVKYVARAGKKGGKEKEIEDLEKAGQYLGKRIEELKKEGTKEE